MRFELTFNEGQKRELLLYVRPDNANNYFGWIEGEDELITVQQFVFGPFLVEKTYFVEK